MIDRRPFVGVMRLPLGPEFGLRRCADRLRADEDRREKKRERRCPEAVGRGCRQVHAHQLNEKYELNLKIEIARAHHNVVGGDVPKLTIENHS